MGLKANLISGDDDPNDLDLQTVNPLFPKDKYFGELSLLGPYNLINLHPSIGIELGAGWALSLASVFYWRQSTGDGIYDNGGNLIRGDLGNKARFIGTQVEVVLEYEYSRNRHPCVVLAVPPGSLHQGHQAEQDRPLRWHGAGVQVLSMDEAVI